MACAFRDAATTEKMTSTSSAPSAPAARGHVLKRMRPPDSGGRLDGCRARRGRSRPARARAARNLSVHGRGRLALENTDEAASLTVRGFAAARQAPAHEVSATDVAMRDRPGRPGRLE